MTSSVRRGGLRRPLRTLIATTAAVGIATAGLTFSSIAPATAAISDPTFTSGNNNIPSNPNQGLPVTWTTSGLTGPVTSVTVGFTLAHEDVDAVSATLSAPGGSPSITLFSNLNAQGSDEVNKSFTFSDNTDLPRIAASTGNGTASITGNTTSYRPQSGSLATTFANATINGTWTLTVQGSAGQGQNASNPRTLSSPSLTVVGTTVAADTTPPVTPTFGQASTADAATVGTAGPTYAFSSTSTDVARYECAVDSTVAYEICTSPVTVPTTGLADGLHTFRVLAVDNSGNVSVPASRTFTLDKTGPVTEIVNGTADGARIPAASGVSYSFSSDETNSTFECAVTAAGATASYGACTSTFIKSTQGLVDGTTYTFSVRAKDAVGNTGAPVSRTFVYDTTAPVVSITGGPGDGWNINYKPTYTFTSSDADLAKFQCSVTSASSNATRVSGYTDCTSPFTANTTAAGSYTFSVKAIDKAGNESVVASRNYSITVEPRDTVVPTISFTSGPAEGAIVTTAPTYGFTSPDSDIAGYQCAVDGNGFVDCTSPFTVANPSVATHSLAVRAIDISGNVSAIVIRSFTYAEPDPTDGPDTTAPSVAFTGGPDDAAVVDAAPTYEFASTDTDVVGYQCSIDTADFAACTSPITLTGLADGNHSLAVRAVDAAGNLSSVITRTFTLVTTNQTCTDAQATYDAAQAKVVKIKKQIKAAKAAGKTVKVKKLKAKLAKAKTARNAALANLNASC